MALVGDLLLAARELFPDPPQTILAPTVAPSCGSIVGTLPVVQYYVKYTALTAWGETTASPEANSGGGVTGFSVTGNVVAGATSYRVYFGITTGGQNQYVTVAAPGAGATTFTVNVTAFGAAGVPPTINRAWYPDTDGATVGVYSLYRWLNEGLGIAARVTGGIRDITGVAVNVNQVFYPLTNQWLKITEAWYDGWPLQLGSHKDTFQRTRVTGISGILVADKLNETQTVELWPIPSRTAASTTLNGGIAATDTTIALASVVGLLDHGLIKVDNELIAYGAISGTSLVQCQRGLGGSVAAAHSNGAAVTELNIRMIGYRMPELYTVGSSALTLTVPPAWESMLPNYLLSRFKAWEQDMQAAQQLRQTFEQEMAQWAKANKPLAGPRQMGAASGIETIPGLGGIGGGVILP